MTFGSLILIVAYYNNNNNSHNACIIIIIVWFEWMTLKARPAGKTCVLSWPTPSFLSPLCGICQLLHDLIQFHILFYNLFTQSNNPEVITILNGVYSLRPIFGLEHFDHILYCIITIFFLLSSCLKSLSLNLGTWFRSKKKEVQSLPTWWATFNLLL